MKLWAGSYHGDTDKITDDFNSSIAFDKRMYRQDITGSIAHAKMLGDCGIIPKEDSEKIIQALGAILMEINGGQLQIDPGAEDIHSFIEAELTKRIGDAGKRLHTARSRNDQVALDLRLYLMSETGELKRRLAGLIEVLCNKAQRHGDTVMCGYTHLQRAQPVTFGHHLMAYAFMFLRDIERLNDCRGRMNRSPLGSGALAGTTYPIDRHITAALLGMERLCMNSMDGVSDRDFAMELLAALSIIMVHLSRFSEEIILWCSGEFGYIKLSDAFSTGSSIMPQKKNPDVAELVRGKSGRVFGDLMGLLTVMKGLPLAYNKDMQEDKEAVFDALDTVNMCLDAFTPMVDTMAVCGENMRKTASGGFINATDAADYLTSKGMPFRDAYRIAGELVARCIVLGVGLEDLAIDEYREKSVLFDEDIYDAVSLETCVNGRKTTGGPARESVAGQIKAVRQELESVR